MERVTGIGGIFFKARDADALRAWYRDHLGIPVESWGGWAWEWGGSGEGGKGLTVWSPFPESSDYFAPSAKPFMINLRVRDLDAMLAQLRTGGCRVLERRADEENGRFGYVLDPEDNLVELWEPAAES